MTLSTLIRRLHCFHPSGTAQCHHRSRGLDTGRFVEVPAVVQTSVLRQGPVLPSSAPQIASLLGWACAALHTCSKQLLTSSQIAPPRLQVSQEPGTSADEQGVRRKRRQEDKGGQRQLPRAICPRSVQACCHEIRLATKPLAG